MSSIITTVYQTLSLSFIVWYCIGIKSEKKLIPFHIKVRCLHFSWAYYQDMVSPHLIFCVSFSPFLKVYLTSFSYTNMYNTVLLLVATILSLLFCEKLSSTPMLHARKHTHIWHFKLSSFFALFLFFVTQSTGSWHIWLLAWPLASAWRSHGFNVEPCIACLFAFSF